jgi:hypothetical protein
VAAACNADNREKGLLEVATTIGELEEHGELEDPAMRILSWDENAVQGTRKWVGEIYIKQFKFKLKLLTGQVEPYFFSRARRQCWVALGSSSAPISPSHIACDIHLLSFCYRY